MKELRCQDWSKVPREILEQICKRLAIPDHFRFANVCKTWLAATSNKAKVTLPDTPWLITNEDTTSRFFLFSSSLQKNLKLHKSFRPFRGSFIVGSIKGWLVIRSPTKVFILNVFSKLRIELPPRSTIPGFRKTRGINANGRDTPLAFTMLTCAGFNPIMVAAVTKDGGLVWCKIDNKGWNRHQGGLEYGNLTFHNEKLYAINRYGTKIDIFQVDDESQVLILLDTILLPNPLMIPSDTLDVYLVESKGSLLVAKRYYDKSKITGATTIGFDIFKVEENYTPPRVVSMDSLEDQALFISGLNCESIYGKDCPGLDEGRIYCVGPSSNGSTSELGVFIVKGRHLFRVALTHTNLPPPIWVLPRFAFECECKGHDLALWKPKNKKRKQAKRISN